MGLLEQITFAVQRGSIIQRSSQLHFLQENFSIEKIEYVVKMLPNDKAHVPDGFNNEFIKKCWPIIKQDFFNLCSVFKENIICLHSINCSFITLIPNVDRARYVNDFRPMSLLNSSVKRVTKLLANRLPPVITTLIHQNQYGFIKSRTIQDCLAWSFEYLHLCHHSQARL